jgi:hypothetical protein
VLLRVCSIVRVVKVVVDNFASIFGDCGKEKGKEGDSHILNIFTFDSLVIALVSICATFENYLNLAGLRAKKE